jgi:hypothetical protein
MRLLFSPNILPCSLSYMYFFLFISLCLLSHGRHVVDTYVDVVELLCYYFNDYFALIFICELLVYKLLKNMS